MRKKRLETYSICTCVTDGSGEHGRSRCRCEARFGREDKGEAMGRYLEEELTLPEETATVEKSVSSRTEPCVWLIGQRTMLLKLRIPKITDRPGTRPEICRVRFWDLRTRSPVWQRFQRRRIFAVSSMPTEDPDAFCTSIIT